MPAPLRSNPKDPFETPSGEVDWEKLSQAILPYLPGAYSAEYPLRSISPPGPPFTPSTLLEAFFPSHLLEQARTQMDFQPEGYTILPTIPLVQPDFTRLPPAFARALQPPAEPEPGPSPVTPEGTLRSAVSPGEMTVMPGGILAHLPQAATPIAVPSPVPSPVPTVDESAPTPEEAVRIADLPGEELGSLRRMVEAALAAGRPVEAMTPEGTILPLKTIEDLPAGIYGEGGYMDVPEGPLTLMRKGPVVNRDALISRVMENPWLYAQKLESKMGNDGLSMDRRQSMRQSLGEMLLEAGYNPGVVNMYLTKGLNDPALNQYLAQEFSSEKAFSMENSRIISSEVRADIRRRAAEQEQLLGRQKLMMFEALMPHILKGWVDEDLLDPIVLEGYMRYRGMEGTTVRMTDAQRKVLTEYAKALGMRGAVIELPGGEIITPLFKHKGGLFGWLVNNEKELQAFRTEILSGKKFPDDVLAFSMKPQRIQFNPPEGPSPLLGSAATASTEEKKGKAAVAADTFIQTMSGK